MERSAIRGRWFGCTACRAAWPGTPFRRLEIPAV